MCGLERVWLATVGAVPGITHELHWINMCVPMRPVSEQHGASTLLSGVETALFLRHGVRGGTLASLQCSVPCITSQLVSSWLCGKISHAQEIKGCLCTRVAMSKGNEGLPVAGTCNNTLAERYCRTKDSHRHGHFIM
eukprot:scaffold52421_cov19-Tisochrysis_lutea.AAC.1